MDCREAPEREKESKIRKTDSLFPAYLGLEQIIHIGNNILSQCKTGLYLLVVDWQGNCFYANDTIKDQMNISLPTNIYDIKENFMVKRLISALTEKQVIKELTEFSEGDEVKYYDITAAPIYEEGEIIGGIVIANDVTEKENLKRRLIDSERIYLIGEMAARIMHDIRNPLQIAKSSVQMMEFYNQKGGLSWEKADKFLSSIKEAIENVVDLMNDMLQLSKPSISATEEIDLEELFSDICRLYKATFQKYSIQVQIELQDHIKIHGDPKLLQQAFMNIIQNAIEVLQEDTDKRLKIRTYNENHQPVIEIFNSGPLIADETRTQIFQPFFSTKGISGTGLGLAITKEIIENVHHGQIICESNRDLNGTAFYIRFPTSGINKK